MFGLPIAQVYVATYEKHAYVFSQTAAVLGTSWQLEGCLKLVVHLRVQW